jgi:exosortase/archaeosortase family protein
MARLNKNIKKNQKKNKQGADGFSTWRFIIIYLVLMLAFFLAMWFKPIHNVVDLNGLYTNYVITLTSKALVLLGIPCTFNGSIIELPSISLDVKFGCNGIEAVMMYSIAVLAYPAPWKKKTAGIIAGFFILQTANIVRIVLLVYSALHFKNLFDYIHVYIAQGIMIALSLAVFFIYLNHAETAKTVNS